MADNKNKPRFGSLQPDVEDLLHWNDLADADFSKASAAEKEDFIQQRQKRIVLGGRVAPAAEEHRGHGGAVRAGGHHAVCLCGPGRGALRL